METFSVAQLLGLVAEGDERALRELAELQGSPGRGVLHDPESDRVALTRAALAFSALAVLLGVLTMTVGHTDAVISPGVCGFC